MDYELCGHVIGIYRKSGERAREEGGAGNEERGGKCKEATVK